MPKKQFDYKAAMKKLRPNVNFNFDLRKPLSRGAKATIRKAWNEFEPHKYQRLIKPRKKKGETKQQYTARLKEIKQNTGQDTKFMKGVFQMIPKNAPVSFKDNRLHVRAPANPAYREKHVGLDQEMMLSDMWPSYIRGVIDRHQEDFTFVHPGIWGNRATAVDIRQGADLLIETIAEIQETYQAGSMVHSLIFIKGFNPDIEQAA